MSEEEEKREIAERIEYEKFCDAFTVNYKKGIFALDLGQGITEPVRMVVRIWMDDSAMKTLSDFLKEQIEEYEEKFGEIEET